jgi:hypothetical protein
MTTAASVACGIIPMRGGEKKHGHQRGSRCDNLRQLGARTRQAVDRGLAGSAAAGHGPQHRAARIREPRRQQFLVRPDRRLPARREPTPDGDRLGEAHQRNAQGARPELFGKGEVRPGKGWEALGDLADGLYTVGAQTEQAHAGDPERHRDQRRRRPREEPLRHHQNGYRGGPDGQCDRRGVGDGLHDGEQIVEERALGEMDTQEFRDLVQDDDEPDSRFKADQDRFGNEIGDETQPQERRQHQDGSHQQRQHGRRTQQGRRIPGRDDLAGFGARQDGQRRGGAHTERARGSEHRIDQHGQERRVKAHLDR